MLLKGFILPPTTRKGIGNSIKDIKFVSIDNYFLQLNWYLFPLTLVAILNFFSLFVTLDPGFTRRGP